jgi:uncharacterized protein
MKSEVLFIHGAGEGAYKEDKKLADNLQELLGSQFSVRAPKMENESEAPYNVWMKQIKEDLASMNENIFLVGHSVGASVLIKFLAEEKIEKSLTGIHLIASPFWGGDGGWTYDGYKTLELPPHASAKLPKNVPLFFYHSDDDETVPFEHLALFAKTFPNSQIRTIHGRGHQLKDDLSEIVNDITSVVHQRGLAK